jgi:Pectate lyase superfamily protein
VRCEVPDLNRRRLLYGAGSGVVLAISGKSLRPKAAVKANLTSSVKTNSTPAANPTPAVKANSTQQTPGSVNVRDYGAAGNGIADDTAAINAAISAATGTAAPASNTRFPSSDVYLPPGTYKVTSDLLIQSVEGFAFSGAGAELSILRASGTGFTTAVLNIDGSAKSSFQGFSIAGDGTEGSGGNALPNAINLTWTTAARRSTTANVFSDIYVRGLKFSCGMRMGAPSGTTRQVDGTTIRDVIIAGLGNATFAYTTLYLYGFYFGNGITGNQYDYVAYNSYASGCQTGVYSNASGFEWYGGQPAQNATEFRFAGAPVQATIQGIQSQASGQLLNVTGGSGSATVSVRDVLFSTNSLVSSGYWIQVTGIARGWEFSNVRAYTGTASPVIFFSGSGSAEVATLINVAQQNTVTAGIVVQSGGSVKLVNYMQLAANGQVAAVWHDFIINTTSGYNCTQSDRYVLADATKAAYKVTLPNASLCPGKAYTVKKVDSSAHAVTITSTASQTVDGATTYQLRAQYNAVDLVSNGSNWFVTAKL